MSQPCPTCGKPVDPIRSRFVGVRAGKVVAYCSPECAAAAETKPTAVPVARRTPAAGVVAGAAVTLDSGPVIEIIREPASAPVPVAVPAPSSKKNGRAASEVKSPEVASAPPERPSSRAMTPLPVAPRGGRGMTVVILVIALIGAAGAFLAYRFLIANTSDAHDDKTELDKPAPPAPPPTPPAPPPPPAVTATEAVAKARDTLVKNLASESPRVQRVAAAALARTGDAGALAYLTSALAKETSDVSKLDLAYALARANDKKGFETLVAGLGSARRDVRAQAGRQLALLGDKRAVPVLASYLDVSQLRLGAAEQLAYLADPAAIKALDTIRADPKSTADEKSRATIALAIAGRSDVVPDLVKLLADAHFNAFAASALAQLRDVRAKPVLAEQLAVPSLRVEAARSLRRLDAKLDPAPFLPGLLAALPSHKDTEQVQVAEAILLLAGDAGWSERP